jgi:putative phage-type endonuclease
MRPYSTEWYQARATHIGSSDAAILMGVAPKTWGTPLSLFLEKKGLQKREINKAMKRGVVLEDFARYVYEEQTNRQVFPDVFIHSTHDWMMATLDGIDADKTILVELKCPGQEDHKTALEGKMPDKYYPQLQHQLACTGLNKAHYFSFDGANGVIIEVTRDEAYINKLIDKERSFWECLVNNIPPEPEDDEYELRLDDQWREHAQAIVALRLQMQALNETEKFHRDRLITLARERNSCGAGVRLRQVVSPGRINYKAIPELSSLNLEQYRSAPSIQWKLFLE